MVGLSDYVGYVIFQEWPLPNGMAIERVVVVHTFFRVVQYSRRNNGLFCRNIMNNIRDTRRKLKNRSHLNTGVAILAHSSQSICDFNYYLKHTICNFNQMVKSPSSNNNNNTDNKTITAPLQKQSLWTIIIVKCPKHQTWKSHETNKKKIERRRKNVNNFPNIQYAVILKCHTYVMYITNCESQCNAHTHKCISSTTCHGGATRCCFTQFCRLFLLLFVFVLAKCIFLARVFCVCLCPPHKNTNI